MACQKWESDGLLFVAGELSEDDSTDYEGHLKECDDCRGEFTAYKEMFGEFSAEELLQEVPSAQCDSKIIAAIDKAVAETEKPVVAMPRFFSMILHRVAVPVAIFAIAVTVGIQISSSSIDGESEVAVKKQNVQPVDTTDSLSDTGRTFIEGGGQGVIPVTLEE